MRLRLHIVRENLPARKVIWLCNSLEPGVDDNVSSLLRSINVVIPLQSANCRLEDYVVELDGFEVLGFQKVSAVFEKDNVVVIRPLHTSELKERQASYPVLSTAGRNFFHRPPPLNRSPDVLPGSDRAALHIPRAKPPHSAKEADTLIVQPDDEDLHATEHDYKLAEAHRLEDEAVVATTPRNADPNQAQIHANPKWNWRKRRTEIRLILEKRKLVPQRCSNTELEEYLFQLGLDSTASIPTLEDAIANVKTQKELKQAAEVLAKDKGPMEKERQSVAAEAQASSVISTSTEGFPHHQQGLTWEFKMGSEPGGTDTEIINPWPALQKGTTHDSRLSTFASRKILEPKSRRPEFSNRAVSPAARIDKPSNPLPSGRTTKQPFAADASLLEATHVEPPTAARLLHERIVSRMNDVARRSMTARSAVTFDRAGEMASTGPRFSHSTDAVYEKGEEEETL